MSLMTQINHYKILQILLKSIIYLFIYLFEVINKVENFF